MALALARLHEKKGLDTLLDATAKVPGLYVWIAGEGPLEAELKAHCTRLGLDDRVRFLGWRNDRGALLAASTFVAFPSRYEPFGTVTVDAWAASRRACCGRRRRAGGVCGGWRQRTADPEERCRCAGRRPCAA